MDEFFFGLLMFICMVPYTIVMFILLYPKDWKKKKRIFGINNRSEFQGGKESEFIDIVATTHRKQAFVIMSIILVISVLLLFVPTFTLKMILWTVFVLIGVGVIFIPYALGNSELKRFKNNRGIISDKTLYADLKNAGSIHVLNKGLIILSSFIGVLIFVFSLLLDLNVLNFAGLKLSGLAGTFILTGINGSYLFIIMLLVFIAVLVDNTRNDVVSENSDVNANFNRSKKKLFANLSYEMILATDAVALLTVFIELVLRSEILMLVLMFVYIVFTMVMTVIFAFNRRKLDDRYRDEALKMAVDDDDYWILGMFYCNPHDKRLNVDKRAGIGYTVNIAHPVGMVIAGFGLLSIIGSILALIWIGMMAFMPIRVYEDSNMIICHHLWDEYKIKESDITEISYGELKDIKAIRTAGTGMENVLKGTFKVNDETGCKMFLNPKAEVYIKIVTKDKTYYISDNTKEETQELLEQIND